MIDLAGAAEHADLCEAALAYLLERDAARDRGSPREQARLKLMVVDEAWRYLADPAVLAYLAEAAKTWRKKNAALVLATQSAVDMTGTSGASALLESIPTKLFLANPELPGEVGDLFRLNQSEVVPDPGADAQARAVSPPPGRGGRAPPRSRSRELLALHVLAARRREARRGRRATRTRHGRWKSWRTRNAQPTLHPKRGHDTMRLTDRDRLR